MKRSSNRQGEHGSVLIVGLLLAVLLVLGAGFLVYRHEQKAKAIADEHAQYTQAEGGLENLASVIQKKAGITKKVKKVDICGHASSDFGTGSLYCDTNVYLIYDGKITKTASELAILTRTSGGVFSTFGPEDNNGHVTSKTFLLSGLSCFVDFANINSDTSFDSLGYKGVDMTLEGNGAIVQLNCSVQHPRAAYYPIQN